MVSLVVAAGFGVTSVSSATIGRLHSVSAAQTISHGPVGDASLASFGISLKANAHQPAATSATVRSVDSEFISSLERADFQTDSTAAHDHLVAVFGRITTNRFPGESPNSPFVGWIIFELHTKPLLVSEPVGAKVAPPSANCTTFSVLDPSTGRWSGISQTCG